MLTLSMVLITLYLLIIQFFFTDFQNPEAIVFVSYNFTVIFSRSQMISTV